MIVCQISDFVKLVNLDEKTTKVSKGNYWVITRQGREHTLHVIAIENEWVIAKITKSENLKGLVKGVKGYIKSSIVEEGFRKILEAEG